MMKVAVAIITDRYQNILLTQRAAHISHGGFWEFPGGKLECNESPEMALIREVKEEVGLDVLAYRYLGAFLHQYDMNSLILYGYHVSEYRGEARCCESQTALHWVDRCSLNNYQFPAANKELINQCLGGGE